MITHTPCFRRPKDPSYSAFRSRATEEPDECSQTRSKVLAPLYLPINHISVAHAQRPAASIVAEETPVPVEILPPVVSNLDEFKDFVRRKGSEYGAYECFWADDVMFKVGHF